MNVTINLSAKYCLRVANLFQDTTLPPLLRHPKKRQLIHRGITNSVTQSALRETQTSLTYDRRESPIIKTAEIGIIQITSF
ncbi:hypothetical protein VNO77_33384 [Canavalia gladiata]|uniref:Uncharacterized protein n=1 Tax=Canavalia gladiata TaxID=3824 RepID=A0AAN9PXN7_CANGL